jgi:hypothetical protein
VGFSHPCFSAPHAADDFDRAKRAKVFFKIPVKQPIFVFIAAQRHIRPPHVFFFAYDNNTEDKLSTIQRMKYYKSEEYILQNRGCRVFSPDVSGILPLVRRKRVWIQGAHSEPV